PAGDYFIVADPLKIPSYFPGTGSRDESTPVSVKAGDVINGRAFRFVRNSGILGTTRTRSSGESRLSGVVRDTQGRGIPNFTVKLSGFDKDDRRWTVTDASGHFAFTALRPGEFSLDVLTPIIEDLYEDLRVPITLHPQENLDQQLGVRRFGNFEQRPDLYAP